MNARRKPRRTPRSRLERIRQSLTDLWDSPVIRKARGGLKRSRLPLTVAAFYILPVLFFIDKNINEITTIEAWVVIAVTALFGLAVWGFGWLFVRNWHRAALFAAVMSFLTFQYKEWLEWVKPLFIHFTERVITTSYLFFLLLIPLLLFLISRIPAKRARGIGTYLSILIVCLLAYAAWPIHAQLSRNSDATVTLKRTDVANAAAHRVSTKPDIYYLVFDRYTGPIGLKENFQFDNSPFLDQLRDRGFYVTDESFSNYPTTAPSLASSLNGSELVMHGDIKKPVRTPYFKFYRKPAAATFLKRQGYEFVQVGAWWQGTHTSDYADQNPRFAWQVNVLGQEWHVRYFSGLFIKGTVFGDAYDRLSDSLFSQLESHGDTFLAQMDEIERQAKASNPDRPKLVFAHMLMPHHPLVFDKKGGKADPKLSRKAQYLEQLQFTNRRINQALRTLLASADPKRQPIVVLTADEGEYPLDYTSRAPDRYLRQKTNILSATYYPNRDYEQLYPTITPVNYFRVLFNTYFGTDLALQPDRIRTRNKDKRNAAINFVDITERVRR